MGPETNARYRQARGENDMNKTRRGFLKNLGGATVGVVAAVVPAAPRIEEEVIKKVRVEHEFVTEKHFLMQGDGTKDGDRAMLKVNGDYRSHVLRNGKWVMMFPN
jgi:hypothetical protein